MQVEYSFMTTSQQSMSQQVPPSLSTGTISSADYLTTQRRVTQVSSSPRQALSPPLMRSPAVWKLQNVKQDIILPLYETTGPNTVSWNVLRDSVYTCRGNNSVCKTTSSLKHSRPLHITGLMETSTPPGSKMLTAWTAQDSSWILFMNPNSWLPTLPLTHSNFPDLRWQWKSGFLNILG